MPEIEPPTFGEQPRPESPGEEAQRVGGTLVKLAIILKMDPTPAEKDALSLVSKMGLRWMRKIART